MDDSSLPGFSNEVLDYYVTLPVGTTQLPNVSAVAGADYQTITIVNGGLNGTTTVIVEAQDGTTKTFNIHFDVELSTGSHLNMIYLAHEAMVNGSAKFTVDIDFDSSVTNYQVTLPIGTRQYPTITWDNGDDYQIATLNEVSQGVYEINVTAQDTLFKTTYHIEFVILQSQNSALTDIIINGESLSTDAVTFLVNQSFDPSTWNYQLQWPIGTSVLPAVTFVAGDTMQQVTVTLPTHLNDSIVITVQVEDPTFVTRYVIHCELLLSENSRLNDISLNGTTIAGFHPDSLNYQVLLPIGTTVMPQVEWQVGDLYPNVSYTNGGLNGQFVITVKAQDTTFVSTYIIHFAVEQSRSEERRVGKEC